jgi:hypothetical protein
MLIDLLDIIEPVQEVGTSRYKNVLTTVGKGKCEHGMVKNVIGGEVNRYVSLCDPRAIVPGHCRFGCNGVKQSQRSAFISCAHP